MRKTLSISFLLFFTITLISCTKTKPMNETIIGSWEAKGVNKPITYNFKSDGVLTTSINEFVFNYKWEISDNQLKLYKDDKLDKSFNLSFLNDNEMEWDSDKFFGAKKKFIMQRKNTKK